jgi:hypothetical protein
MPLCGVADPPAPVAVGTEGDQVAMESTGVYWKPVWAALEGHFELILANPF